MHSGFRKSKVRVEHFVDRVRSKQEVNEVITFTA